MKKIPFFLFVLVLFLLPFYWYYFGPVGGNKETEIFIIPKNFDAFNLVQQLEEQKFIKKNKLLEFYINTFVFFNEIKPGGYRLSRNMWALDVFKKVNQDTLFGCMDYRGMKQPFFFVLERDK